MAPPMKRKLDDALNQPDDDVIFVMKHEPEEVQRNHLVKLLVGNHVQLCTQRAIQELLPDPASFQAGTTTMSKGKEYRVIIPEDVDAWAAHIVLLAALNEDMPLDCTSTANGLTLQKLRKAAEFFKVDDERIGLVPEKMDVNVMVPELTAAVSDEPQQAQLDSDSDDMDCDDSDDPDYEDSDTEPQPPPTGNNQPQVPAEIVDCTLDMPNTGDIYLFTGDRNQTYLRQYDCSHGRSFPITMPQKMQDWAVYKEMGPMIAGGLLFRRGDGLQMKTYAYRFANKQLQSLFGDGVDNGVNYPLAVMDGMVYRWDFKTKGAKGNKSLKYDLENEQMADTTLHLPKKFREQAVFVSSDDKFYYCGGFLISDKTRAPVSTVEVYDVDGNKWSKLPNMKYARRCFAAHVCNGYLYVTGGVFHDSTGIRRSCERLKLETRKAKWESIGPLRKARYQHSMFVLDGQVYVCGGRKALGMPATSVECYDEEHKCWRKVDADLGWPISACQASE